MKTGVLVADAMNTHPVTISPTATILECAKVMVKKRVGSLLIIKENKLEGIITEKDLVHLLSKGFNPKEMKVRDIMVKKVHSISPEIDLYDALLHMKREKVRRLPVIKNKTLVGMLTLNDVMKLQPALLDLIREKSFVRVTAKKEKPIEGTCEVCENFGKLYEVDDQYMCSDCREEQQTNAIE